MVITRLVRFFSDISRILSSLACYQFYHVYQVCRVYPVYHGCRGLSYDMNVMPCLWCFSCAVVLALFFCWYISMPLWCHWRLGAFHAAGALPLIGTVGVALTLHVDASACPIFYRWCLFTVSVTVRKRLKHALMGVRRDLRRYRWRCTLMLRLMLFFRWTLLPLMSPLQETVKHALIGVCRDLRGVTAATNNRRSYGMLFDVSISYDLPCFINNFDYWQIFIIYLGWSNAKLEGLKPDWPKPKLS